MAYKLSFACAEMILSYRLSPQQIFFTHKLEPVTSLLWLCLCLFLCGLFLFGFVFGVVFASVFLVSVRVPQNVTRA